jgi:ABC-type proline/glycine betaine transport system permease subunit
VSRIVGVLKRTNVSGWLVVVLVAVLVELGVRFYDLHDSVAAPSEAVRALVDGLSRRHALRRDSNDARALRRRVRARDRNRRRAGILIGSSRTLLDASSVVLEILRPIPAVALIPVAFLFVDIGTPMIRFVIVYAAVWPILVNTLYGVRGVDRMLHDVASTSGVGHAGRLVRVTLPAALPSIWTGIRVSAPIALLVGVTAEYLTLTGGIGSYLQQKQNAGELPEMYAAVGLTALLGYTINVVSRATQRRVVFWAGEERVAWR